MIDGAGFIGTIVIFAMMFAFCSSAFLLFFYFWWNKRLDMDDEAALRMMDEDEHGRR